MKNETQTTGGPTRETLTSVGSCCFTCVHWIGKRRKGTAYCKRLNLSGKDAPRGDAVCILWEKRINARMPNASRQESPGDTGTTGGAK